jgi:hypothetical protein
MKEYIKEAIHYFMKKFVQSPFPSSQPADSITSSRVETFLTQRRSFENLAREIDRFIDWI